MKQPKETKDETVDQGLSRRDFMKAAGAAAIGMGVAGCAPALRPPSGTQTPPESGPQTSRRTRTDSADYDVVVIGTGMGGSAAGAIAALHGLKTLILEKNPRPGGSCSYYEKQGFRIDTGAHMFIQGNNGPFGALTKRLGMGTPIRFVKAQNTLEIRGINMWTLFPRNIIGRVLNLPKLAWQTQINPVQFPSIINMFRKILLMSEREIERWDHVSINEFMAAYTSNEEVRSMLAGILGLMLILPPGDASAGESIWNLQKLMTGMSVGYPKGGSSIISRTFLQGAENNGAQVRMSAGVRKIEIKDGQVESVILDNGERIKTRSVISTTAIKDTILKLAGEDYFPAEYVASIKAIIPSFTAVQAKLALKKQVIRAGCLVGGIPIKSDRNIVGEFTGVAFGNAASGVQGDYIPIYAPVPSIYDEQLAPPGCQLVTAVALAPPLSVQLQDSQQSWVDGMMRTLYAMIPDLDEHLIFCDTWSVGALAAWTGKSDGSAISTGQSINQVAGRRPAHKTAVKGLYLAGDCAGPARGVGTELACQSGMDCGDLVAREFANSLL